MRPLLITSALMAEHPHRLLFVISDGHNSCQTDVPVIVYSHFRFAIRDRMGRPVFHPAVSELRSSGVIFDSSAPISYPEKIVQGPRGNLLVLDSELSNVFVVNAASEPLGALCERRLPITPSDIATNSLGDIWVLNSAQRRVARVDDRCQIATAFTTRSFPNRPVVNSAGEICGIGPARADSLFETYDSTGKLLRSFGQRLSYGSDIADPGTEWRPSHF